MLNESKTELLFEFDGVFPKIALRAMTDGANEALLMEIMLASGGGQDGVEWSYDVRFNKDQVDDLLNFLLLWFGDKNA
jgi:hypothetical protein